jgi:hypothetical protein
LIIYYCVILSAQGTPGLAYTLINNDTAYEVSKGTTQSIGITSIVIPDNYNGLPVIRVASNAFQNYTTLESVIISNGITTINSYAFDGCSNLLSATLPNSLTSLGSYSFRNCTRLASINFPASLSSSSAISGLVFRGCSVLENITVDGGNSRYRSEGNCVISGTTVYLGGINSIIPSGITLINTYAFDGRTNLTSIHIPDSVTSIGTSAFNNCTNLSNITLGRGITSISNFPVTINLDYITVSSENTTFRSEGNCLIRNSDDMLIWGTNNSIIPNGITGIADSAFRDRKQISEIHLPNGVSSIGTYTFSGCSNLADINIPNGVTSIGTYAFQNCNSLTEVNLPNSVTSIGSYAFYGCSGLTDFHMSDNVASIGDRAFQNCSNLTEINIPSGVTSIGTYTFSGCINLAEITLSNGLVSIGTYAFSGCSSLSEVHLPDSVTLIGDRAFQNCNNLADINIPSGVTSIGTYAFQSCSGLTSINIPNSVITIGSYAFTGCNNLIIFADFHERPSGWNSNWNPSNRPVIWLLSAEQTTPGIAFNYLNATDSYEVSKGTATSSTVVIPPTYAGRPVTRIANSAFASYTQMYSITIPASITEIGTEVFNRSQNLTQIIVDPTNAVFISDGNCLINRSTNRLLYGGIDAVIPSYITSIGDFAFTGRNISSIDIPEGVTSIGENAFYGCSNLSSIHIPASVTSIGINTGQSSSSTPFSNCDNLEIITVDPTNSVFRSEGNCVIRRSNNELVIGVSTSIIPNSATSIGAYAFASIPITTIDIPINISSIGTYAFSGTGLRSVNIPNSVTSIGAYAFQGCNISNIYIPLSVTTMGRSIFFLGGGNNTKIYTEWENRPSGWDASWNYYNSPVVWGYVVTQDLEFTLIDNDTAYEVSKGTATDTNVTIPNEYNGLPVKKIADYGFSNYTNLTKITLPDHLTTIGVNAFSGCNNLTTTNIHNYITTIESGAFSNCSSLFSLYIPSNITTIGNNAFNGCNNLTVYTEFESRPDGWDTNWNPNNRPVIWNMTKGLSYNLINNSYYEVSNGTATAIDIVIPPMYNGLPVTRIADNAFRDRTNLNLTLPSSITSIGTEVFNNTRILNITIDPANTTFVSDGNCLIDISEDNPGDFANILLYGGIDAVIPSYVTSIGDNAFYGRAIVSIDIPEGVISIGETAFYGCLNLTSLLIPASVTSFTIIANSNSSYSNPFTRCDNLDSITVDPANLVFRSEGNCIIRRSNNELVIGFSSSVIPDGVTSIGNSAFVYFNKTSLEIPNGVTSIGATAFADAKIASIELPNSITSIGSFAFYWCQSLTSINIPNSLTSIGQWAFNQCNLSSIYIPLNVTTIGSYAFYSNRNLNIYTEWESKPSGWNSNWNPSNRPVIWGFTSTPGLAFNYVEDLEAFEVSKGTATDANVIIPSEYNTVPVKRIAESGFAEYTNMISITIPESIIEIGNLAFLGCSHLENITVNNDNTIYRNENNCLIRIADNTLIQGTLHSVIPETVVVIGDNAFRGLKIDRINISNNVMSIGGSTFADCSELTSILIPNTISSIGPNAFGNCDNLTIYTEWSSEPAGWLWGMLGSWNESNRPVIWASAFGSELTTPISEHNFSSFNEITFSWENKYPNNLQEYRVYLGTELDNLEMVYNDFEPTFSLNHSTLTYENEYYWQVVPHKDYAVADSTLCPIWTFTTYSSPPEAAVLTQPVNSSISINPNTEFKWQPVDVPSPQVQYYQFYIGTNSSFENGTYQIIETTEPFCTLETPLEYETEYFWKIIGVNGAGVGEESQVWSFKTLRTPPYPASVVFPGDLTSRHIPYLTLHWVSDSTRVVTDYIVKLGTEYPPIEIIYTGVSDSLLVFLDYETTYYWQVIPVNFDSPADSVYCMVWSFETLETPSPFSPILSSPVNGATNVPFDQKFSWTDAEIGPSSEGYKLYIGTNVTNLKEYVLTEATWNPEPLLLPNTTYIWYVIPFNYQGDGPYSEVWSFTTLPPPPSVVNIQYPQQNAVNIPITPEFLWLPSTVGSVPDNYSLFISSDGEGYIEYELENNYFQVLEALLYQREYFWYVVAYNEYGISPETEIHKFTTTLPPPSAVALVYPDNLEDNISVNVELSWRNGDDGSVPEYYSIFMGTDPDNMEEYEVETNSWVPEFTLSYSTKYHWYVVAVNEYGISPESEIRSFKLEAYNSDDDMVEVSKTELRANYPNPFNPETTIKCGMRNTEWGTIEIFNIKGQKVKTLFDGYLEAGEHSFVWNGDDENGRSVGSGIYFCRMTTKDYSKVQKMILMK